MNTAACLMKSAYTFILSTFLFMAVMPELKAYLLLVTAVSCYLLLFYGIRKGTGAKNRLLFENAACILLGNAFGYAAIALIRGARRGDCVEAALLLLLTAALLWMALLAFVLPAKKKKHGESAAASEKNDTLESLLGELKPLSEDAGGAGKLFSHRFYDLERLVKVFARVPIVGIDAEWGNGKTYLVDRFCELPTIRSHYDVIRIDLLSCNYNEIEQVLFRKLDELFKKYGIVSSASRNLRRTFEANAALKLVYDFVFQPFEGYSYAFEGLKRDIAMLDRGVIIVYDDIDRINEPQIVKKIFGISEKLAAYGSDVSECGDKVHILYLFDRGELAKQSFEREYLEKYIPFTMKLTDMTLETTLHEVWQDDALDDLGVTQSELLGALQPKNDLRLEKLFGFSLSMVPAPTSIRKTRIFLQEIRNCLESELAAASDTEGDAKRIRRIGIVFAYIKNYFYPIYELLDQHIGKPLSDVFTVCVDGTELSVNEAVRKAAEQDRFDDYVKAIKDGEGRVLKNKESLALLALFGYPIDVPEQGRAPSASPTMTARGLVIQPELPYERAVRIEDERNRIDHLVANLLQNGRSERTDAQAAVEQLCAEVLPNKGGWREAWREYLEKYYYGKGTYKDNRTVFRLAGDRFLPLFQGFFAYHRSEGEWCELLDFYAELGDNKIDAEWIQNLYYCDVDRQRVYLKALEVYCGAEVVGNLNHVKDYARFLQKFLKPVFYFGYSLHRTFEPYAVESIGELEQHTGFAVEQLRDMLAALEKERETAIPQIGAELRQIEAFIEKNIEVIESPRDILNKVLKVETRFGGSRTKNQETVDAFQNGLKHAKGETERAQIRRDIEQAYQEGKLTPYEVSKLTQEPR